MAYEDKNAALSAYAQTPQWYDQNRQGGSRDADSPFGAKKFYGIDTPEVINGTIASGQVLKAGTFLVYDADSNFVASGNIAETADVTFGTALTVGQTLILGGLTFTSGASGTTVEQLALAWGNLGEGIADGTGFAALTKVTNAKAGGTFTAGTLTGFATSAIDANTVVFNAVPALSDVTDLAATGTGAGAATVTVVAGSATFVKPVAVTMYDVDATAAAVDVQVYRAAHFEGDSDGRCFLRWVTDSEETVYNAASEANVAVTAYNTGCDGDTAQMQKFKRRYVSDTNFKVHLNQPHSNTYDPNDGGAQ